MNDDEIVSSYLHAADQTKQVQILSELNACSKDAIIRVLQNSPRIHDKIVGGGRIPKKDSDNPEKLVGLLKEEVRNAYKLCLELEEENRKLQHEALVSMKDMIIQLTSSGQR